MFQYLQTLVSKRWKPLKQHMPMAAAMTATPVRTFARLAAGRLRKNLSALGLWLALRGQLGNLISLQRPDGCLHPAWPDVAEDDEELEEGETPAADDAEMEAGEDGEYEGALVAFSILHDHCALFVTYATPFSCIASGCEGRLCRRYCQLQQPCSASQTPSTAQSCSCSL